MRPWQTEMGVLAVTCHLQVPSHLTPRRTAAGVLPPTARVRRRDLPVSRRDMGQGPPRLSEPGSNWGWGVRLTGLQRVGWVGVRSGGARAASWVSLDGSPAAAAPR